MKINFFVIAMLLISGSAFAQTPPTKTDVQAPAADLQMPSGWSKSGGNPQGYDMFRDAAMHRDGKASGTIKSKPSATGFATMMQTIKPDTYRGKRIRLSGYLKTANVTTGSSFWIRVDAPDSIIPLSFDNMGSRMAAGTSDWRKYDLVVDVPDKAAGIAIGFMLLDGGQIWADDLKIEVVDKTVVSTNIPMTPETEAAVKQQSAEARARNPEKFDLSLKNQKAALEKSPLTAANLDFEK